MPALTPKRIRGINGVSYLDQQAKLDVALGDEIIEVHAYVMEGLLRPLIVGHDFLLKVCPIINYRDKTLLMGKHMEVSLPSFLNEQEARESLNVPRVFHIDIPPLLSIPVRLASTQVLSPHTYVDLPVQFHWPLHLSASTPLMFAASSRFMDQNEVILPDFYVHNNTFSFIRVLNPFGFPQLNKGTVIGTLEEINSAVELPIDPALVLHSA